MAFIKVISYLPDCGTRTPFMPMLFIDCLEARLDPIDSDDEWDNEDVIRCSPKVSKMALQCEACGPDLELYQRRR